MDQTDFLIIGAGVVGLAVAAELSQRFPDQSIVVLEKNENFGRETSSRNSEVIHAGIYYPENSLKARLCVAGNRQLYDYCRKWHVPHQRTGKLIVADSAAETATLQSLLAQGKKNGVRDLQLLDSDAVAAMEPGICARAAVLSPSTGTVDSHGLMKRLEQQAAGRHAVLAYHHEVTGITPAEDGYRVRYTSPNGTLQSVVTRWLVNSAGLYADRIAALMGIDIDREGYRLHLCKGEYFSIPASKAQKISHLIYPPPFRDLKGLGIHLTCFPDRSVKLGPNAFYVDRLDYTVNKEHAPAFFNSLKAYLPFLEMSDLSPDMAGIRPKLQKPGEPIHDFVVCHEKDRGLQKAVNLIGIESPGLTSCLSLAKLVADMMTEA